jgi:hypothetical protein
MALVHGAILELPQRLLGSDSRLRRYRVLSRLDQPHIDAHPAIDHNAEIRGAARRVSGVGARHHRLGRNAAGADAGAAEQLPFHDRDLHARGGQAVRQKRPGLSGSDDDCVKLPGHRAP